MACDNCDCGRGAGGCSGASVSLSKSKHQQPRASSSAENTRLWPTKTETSYGATDVPSSSSSSATAAATPEEAGPSSSSSSSSSSPARSKCEKHNGVRGVCCRDLKPDDSRSLIDPDIVRDVIIGLSDGLTVPFALTAGLSGVGSSRIVVLAGLAELVSGAISMGVGGLLSAQAEVQHYKFQLAQTQDRVARSCFGEMEREVREILEPFGVDESLATEIARKLRGVEGSERSRLVQSGGQDGDDRLLPPPATSPRWMRTDGLTGPERGLTPFLLRVGQGMEKVEESRVWISAIVIGASYFLGGFIPLLPYILVDSVHVALLWSIGVTGAILLAFGLVKQYWTGGKTDAKGLIYGATSTLFVGAAAAGSSWIIVRLLEGGSS